MPSDSPGQRPRDETTAPPPPSGSDVTLPPPKSNPSETESGVNRSDATLPPPKSSSDNVSGSDVTLPPPPSRGGGETMDYRPSETQPRGASPRDATIDARDPEAVAYQQKVATGSSGSTPGGASFGDYHLLETIAKGGMGVVYKARQRKLNRIVAIKMILAGQFADQADVQRFYAEAEAAAGLSHPNIVGIHEVGEVNGQHFFSMDYIQGDSLSAMVQESPLTAQVAATFTKTIAETMQFAHERGVVHRDLKPSNVLVDKNNRPLITDFGLAKQSSNRSQLTMEGAIVGTPSYMPPEQARGDAEAVGVCSDIYSTGAILYELITGRPPFRAATPFETVRQVIEMEPLSPRQLNPAVPKDLETICLKCLQKEPTKRYETSQQLADELGRFLRGEPIVARPIGRVARFWRLCKRYPLVASAIAASVLFLIIAATGATYGMLQAQRALAAKQENERKQMLIVNDMLTSVSESKLANQPGFQPLRKDLLNKALAYYQGFMQENSGNAALQDELAGAHFRVALITEKIDSPEAAIGSYNTARDMQAKLVARTPQDAKRLEAYANTLTAIGSLWVVRKKYSDALESYNEAQTIRERLVATDADNVEYQRVLANARMNIGLTHYNAGEMAAARNDYAAAQATRTTALAKDAKHAKLRHDLAIGDFNLGTLNFGAKEYDAAKTNFASAVARLQQLAVDHPNQLDHQLLLGICQRFQGDVAAELGDLPASRGFYDAASQLLGQLSQTNPNVIDYQMQNAHVQMNRGYLETNNKANAAAIVAYGKARDILLPLTKSYPTEMPYRRDLAKTLQALGFEQALTEDYPQARLQYREAGNLFDGLIQERPKDFDFLSQRAGVAIDLGELELQHGEAKDAVAALSVAIRTREQLVAIAPDDPWQSYDLAVALRTRGEAHRKAQSVVDAVSDAVHAKQLLDAIVKSHPDEQEFKEELKRVVELIRQLATN